MYVLVVVMCIVTYKTKWKHRNRERDKERKKTLNYIEKEATIKWKRKKKDCTHHLNCASCAMSRTRRTRRTVRFSECYLHCYYRTTDNVYVLWLKPFWVCVCFFYFIFWPTLAKIGSWFCLKPKNETNKASHASSIANGTNTTFRPVVSNDGIVSCCLYEHKYICNSGKFKRHMAYDIRQKLNCKWNAPNKFMDGVRYEQMWNLQTWYTYNFIYKWWQWWWWWWIRLFPKNCASFSFPTVEERLP